MIATMKRFKQVAFFAAALCWLSFGLGFGLLLVQFLFNGAGMQLFGDFIPVSSPGVLLGLVYVTGFATAVLVCLAVSYWLFERAQATRETSEN